MEENTENAEEIKTKEHRKYTPVKSTAVVKYTAASAPAAYTKLQCNTDLNLPPSNWLSNSTELYGLHPSIQCRSGFSSFRMAHMFPDCVGVVDIVSDAENVKKLLKMAYSSGAVSLMVHRIENTLLIDEFDVHKYLLREAENQWQWFRKFFIEHFKQSLDEKRICHKDNSRNALKQKSLISKFLYHSLVVSEQSGPKIEEPDHGPSQADPSVAIPLPYTDSTEPVLPDPTLEEKLPDPSSNHKFTRNVIWTFEDLQMLLGTDMPIFGGGTHPCISLRLRDMTKPINVLTGMDYWLDNLMCNVPEVVMCYHLNGIVQKYELIKTEDLPHLENSKFSPKVIRDVAQNILSFLKSNATKAGHTYWLFKGKNDDVVKLYDLTSLCTDVLEERGQTPFTVPVAMLLYRVARNMKHSSESRNQVATIRMLLENCLSLLQQEQYPQIVTSAHYMLSDLYIPSDINPSSPELMEEDEHIETQSDYNDTDKESETNDEDEKQMSVTKSSCIMTLSLSSLGTQKPVKSSVMSQPPPFKSDIETRSKDALKHVLSGLHCLQYFKKENEEDKQRENEPQMAKPFHTIPMPYKTTEPETGSKVKKNRTRKKKKKQVCEPEPAGNKTLCKETKQTQKIPQSWNEHLKYLLYEKACLIFVTLSERCYSQQKYGLALHYIILVLKCKSVMLMKQNTELESCVLGRAGDAFFMIIQNSGDTESHNVDYITETVEEKDILKEMYKEWDGVSELVNIFPKRLDSLESILLASCHCYQKALEFDMKESLLRRLGNIQNEIGVFYMNQAANVWQNEKDPEQIESNFKQFFTKSQTHLESGIKSFENVQDSPNLALLHSNTGRLMRLRAHFHSQSNTERTPLSGPEQHYYNKALTCYQKALQVLGDRKHNSIIWDSVNWELSTALFTIATILQDYPDEFKPHDETEREAVEMLLKALKYCDVETPGTRQPVYQYRSALIQHRLGSLYHKNFRTSTEDDNKKKKVLHLSKLHYKKSSTIFLQLENPSEFLNVQMERVALTEYQTSIATSQVGKLKSLENTLELLLESRAIMKIISDGDYCKQNKFEHDLCEEKQTEQSEQTEFNTLLRLMLLYQSRLLHVLLELTKMSLAKGKKDTDNTGQMYKTMYSVVLKSSQDTTNDVSTLATRLNDVISHLLTIYVSDTVR